MARAAKRKPAARQRRGSPLPAAVQAVRAGAYDTALSLLLEQWQLATSDALANAISLVSLRLKVPPLLRGKTKQARAAWDARAKVAKPQDRPVLLAALADVSSTEAQERLRVIARWMPDPRIDAAIVELLERVPYRATSTRPFWTALFSCASKMTHAKQLRRLPELAFEGVAHTMQGWLRGKVEALRETTRWWGAGENDDPPEALEILALLGPPKLSLGTQNVEALLGAVYDAPDDDAPRLVLADALLERGDPRGELLALQLGPALDRDGKKRERELLELHGTQWLGELAPIIHSDYVFARGFLAECRINIRQLDRVQRLAGHPAWATVRSLGGSALIGLHPVMKGLRRLTFSSFEARSYEGLTSSWRDLLLDTERPLEALRYGGIQGDEHWEAALENNASARPGAWHYVPEAQEIAALCSCRALPRLRELVIAANPERIAPALLGSALLARLETVGLTFEQRPVGPIFEVLAGWLRDAPVPRLVLELGPYHKTLLTLTRGEAGYQRAELVIGPTNDGFSDASQPLIDEAITLVTTLPPSIREGRITPRRHTDPRQLARLSAVVEQLRRISSERWEIARRSEPA